MADFVRIMKNWERMCLSYKSCDDCPMMDADGWAHILCSEGGIQRAVPEIQETVIEKWAAEHPEPVYPTWGEWLQRMYNSMNYAGIFITPIPADIAQKLEIEPKEDV